MTIALVSQEYPPETAKGGIASQTNAKALGLSKLRHDVIVISRSITLNRTETRSGRLTVIRIPGAEGRIRLFTEVADWLSYSVEVAAELERVQARQPIDIIEFPEWAAEGYSHLLNRTEWNDVPVVIQLHGPLVMLAHALGWPDIYSEFYRTGTRMEETCLRLADAIYSSSRCSLEWCSKHYGADPASPILHTGVDCGLFAPRSVAKHDRPTIVQVGKLAPNKGARVLVHAACQVARRIPDLQLRLIGPKEKKVAAELQSLACTAGYPNLIEFAGFVPRERLPEELCRAHVFAAPSFYEGGPGFVYLEAMACGLPVIGCSGSGIDEVVEHGRQGYLLPPDDSKSLADAIFDLLRNPQKAAEMGASGRARALREFDQGPAIARIESFYRAVITRKRSVTAQPAGVTAN